MILAVVHKGKKHLPDIDKVFLLYVFVYVLNGPFWKRSSFCSIHTDAVWCADGLSFDGRWVLNWLWTQTHTPGIGNFWSPRGRTSYGFVELTDVQSILGKMDKCTAFLLQIEARSLRFYLRVSLIWITSDEILDNCEMGNKVCSLFSKVDDHTALFLPWNTITTSESTTILSLHSWHL